VDPGGPVEPFFQGEIAALDVAKLLDKLIESFQFLRNRVGGRDCGRVWETSASANAPKDPFSLPDGLPSRDLPDGGAEDMFFVPFAI
jgi:hypothetical protein